MVRQKERRLKNVSSAKPVRVQVPFHDAPSLYLLVSQILPTKAAKQMFLKISSQQQFLEKSAFIYVTRWEVA